MKKLLCLLAALCLMGGCAMAEDAAQTEAAAQPIAYVRITAGEQSRWFALPEAEPYTITVKQTNPDTGEETINLITITPNGVYMAESNCDNQDCVEMGEVTLENKQERILGNLIVCLPHQIMMELYTTEEIMAMIVTEEGAQ